MRNGQALLEYVLALAGIIAVVGVLGYLVVAAFEYSDRAINLVSGNSP